MKQPYEVLVSIVMTCFNKQKYIKDAIFSIARQTHSNWEIIFVDDVSTDNSLEVLESCIEEFGIKKNRVKIYKNRKNYGCAYSLHKAIKKCNGELIAVLDSDDTLEISALETSLIVHLEHPKVALTYSDYNTTDEKLKYKKTYCTKQIPQGIEYAISMLFFKPEDQIRISPLRVFKTELYNKTEGINPELKQCIDKELVLRLEEMGPLLHIPKVLYNYRHVSNSITNKKGKYLEEQLIINNINRKKIFEDALERRRINARK